MSSYRIGRIGWRFSGREHNIFIEKVNCSSALLRGFAERVPIILVFHHSNIPGGFYVITCDFYNRV